ncbi:MAG: glycerophosphodiester phosphodiesterase [Planctomycetes bacterium]|nr:glycerophosphodiester phosphodiesterase [Planctomycetota bacterium]
MMRGRSLLNAVAGDFRRSWRELALADVAYKIIAFVLLTPLVGILFRVLIAVSGKSVLADQDIVIFFLGPVGWICFVVVGGLWLGIVALEQATLMGILCAATDDKRLGVVGALRFAASNARPVVLVTARLLAFTLLTILPFLAVIGLIYVTLLGEHDINWYLTEKPPVFWVALGLAGVTVAALVALLLRLLTGWFFALPMVLFEDVPASRALRTSRDRATGRRRTLLCWIVGWALASIVLSALGSSLVVFVARLLVPRATGSLWLLLAAIGVTLILWTVANLVVNLLSTTTFATLLFNLYRELGSQGTMDTSRLRIRETTGSGPRLRITPRRLIVAGAAGVVVAVAVGVVAIRTVQLEDHTQVTAHRGASAAAPENTLAAVQRAIDDGADWVEIDVQETADGEVVVFHDSDFMKLAGVNLKIWDATMADLKEIDVGSRFAPEFKDQRVPTLGEVLDTCKGKVGVNIELKYYGHDKQLEQRVAGIVEAHGMTSDIVIMSLKIDAVKKMKEIRPDWKVGLLMSVSAGDLKSVDADFLAVNASFADRRFIRSAHNGKRRREVHVWTVNDAPTMSTMIGRGVDHLITDKPALARSVLEQRAQLSAPERLLLELAGLLGVVPEMGEP